MRDATTDTMTDKKIPASESTSTLTLATATSRDKDKDIDASVETRDFFAPLKTAAKRKPVRDEPANWKQSDVADEQAVATVLPVDGAAQKNPGPMHMLARVKLHSHLAINLFRGRKGDPSTGLRPIIGLARFGGQVAKVWTASMQDDPYADQCLLDIEQAWDAAKQLLTTRHDSLKLLVSGMEDFEVELQTSMEPAELVLDFYCPWAYRGALLLQQYDRVVRLGLTASHIGFLTSAEWTNVVTDSGRSVRNMFAMVNRWTSTGVTRDDIRRGTKVAQRAQAKYTETKRGYLKLSNEVLEGVRRAQLKPLNATLDKYLATKN